MPSFSCDKWLLLGLLGSILWLVDLAEWTEYNWLLQLSHYTLQVSGSSQLSDYTVRLQLYKMISEKLSS